MWILNFDVLDLMSSMMNTFYDIKEITIHVFIRKCLNSLYLRTTFQLEFYSRHIVASVLENKSNVFYWYYKKRIASQFDEFVMDFILAPGDFTYCHLPIKLSLVELGLKHVIFQKVTCVVSVVDFFLWSRYFIDSICSLTWPGALFNLLVAPVTETSLLYRDLYKNFPNYSKPAVIDVLGCMHFFFCFSIMNI